MAPSIVLKISSPVATNLVPPRPLASAIRCRRSRLDDSALCMRRSTVQSSDGVSAASTRLTVLDLLVAASLFRYASATVRRWHSALLRYGIVDGVLLEDLPRHAHAGLLMRLGACHRFVLVHLAWASTRRAKMQKRHGEECRRSLLGSSACQGGGPPNYGDAHALTRPPHRADPHT